MLADIASGETATADVFFLIALIVFLIAAIVAGVFRDIAHQDTIYRALIGAGLAALAVGFLVL